MKTTEHKQFKCKDEVIYQNRLHFGDEKLIWNYGIVNYEDEDYVYLVGGLYINKKSFKILPYEDNEHLVGTTDEPTEEIELEEGEWVIGINLVGGLKRCLDGSVLLGKLNGLTEKDDDIYFDFGNFTQRHIIRFADFNPNDMEETKKHILCVKNGKVVRYKE